MYIISCINFAGLVYGKIHSSHFLPGFLMVPVNLSLFSVPITSGNILGMRGVQLHVQFRFRLEDMAGNATCFARRITSYIPCRVFGHHTDSREARLGTDPSAKLTGKQCKQGVELQSERKAVAGHRDKNHFAGTVLVQAVSFFSPNLLYNRYRYQIREPLSHMY